MGNGNRKLNLAVPVFIDENQTIPVNKFILPDDDKQNSFISSLIYDNPSIIPIKDIAPDFGPLISIAKKVNTEIGSIDNIFINAKGNLTIVETKIRGKVKPQILEFRNELRSWKYETLDQLVQKQQGLSLIDFIKTRQDLSEEETGRLVANIADNFVNSRYLLLIVSERMNTFVEMLFNKFPETKNTSHLGLVKLNIFKTEGDEKLIVIPSCNINYATIDASQKVAYAEKEDGPEVRQFTSDEEQFFEKLNERVTPDVVEFAKQIATETEKIGCIIEWKPTSLIIKFPNPNNPKKLITLFMVQIYGECVQGDIEGQFEKYRIPESISKNFINNLIFTLGFKKGSIQLMHLKPNYQKFLEIIESTLGQIKGS